MGWKDFFKKGNGEKQEETFKELTLKSMEPGYYVDYDLKTWQVSAYNIYDWGAGDKSYEWQLVSSDETIYLELEIDDEEEWCISRKIGFGSLGAKVKNHIMENEDPPDEITYKGVTYYMEEMGGGKFLKGGNGPGHQLVKWDYEDDSGDKYLSIEQWGEEDFEASVGEPVEEYQFTNILPSESNV
jgi:hypothetical protein